MRVFKARVVVEGGCFGEPFVVDRRVSFLGEVDPFKGSVYGYRGSFRDKVLVLEGTRGSTVGSYIVYGLKRYGCAPKCIVAGFIEPILVTGCVIAEIPLYHVFDFRSLVDYIRSLNKPYIVCRDSGEVVVYEEGSTNSY